MKKEKYSRKGFTLVELLIVIVVIGILSAMMMLSSNEAMSSARATKIASDLATLRTATMQWYVDHIDRIVQNGKYIGQVKAKVSDPDTSAKPIQEYSVKDLGVDKYLGHGTVTLSGASNAALKDGCFGIYDAGKDKEGKGTAHRDTWYVGYRFTSSEGSVKEKLRGRLKTLGMHFAGDYPARTGEATIWLKVFGDWSPSK